MCGPEHNAHFAGVFLTGLPKILDSLNDIANWDEHESSSKAKLLYNSIDCEFIITLYVTSSIFSITLPLSTILQKKRFDKQSANDAIKTRTVKKQINRVNYSTDSVEDYFCVAIYNPFLDFIINYINDRFTEETLSIFSLGIFFPQVPMSQSLEYSEYNLRIIWKQFGNVEEMSKRIVNEEDFIIQLKEELQWWNQQWQDKNCDIPNSALDTLIKYDKEIFPLINMLLTVLTTLPPNVELYVKKRKEAHKVLRQEKRKMEKEKIEKLESYRYNPKEFFRQCKTLKNGFKPTTKFVLNGEGVLLSITKDKADEFRKYFDQLLNSEPNLSQGEDDEEWRELTNNNLRNEELEPNRAEIESIIKSLKNNKAAGEDQICAELLKLRGPSLTDGIFNLISMIWRKEEIPTDWRTSVICPIFKISDPKCIENYRGISLLDVGYKVLSICLLRRIQDVSEQMIGDYQCGFRKGKSTIDHIFILRQILRLSINQEKTKYMFMTRGARDNEDDSDLEVDGISFQQFFKSKLFSKRTKTRLYTSIIRPILTYGCEVWTTTTVTQRRLRTFENKIWRRICSPIRDPRTGQWRRKFNQELKEELNIVTVNGFIKSQRIKWLGHVMRRNTDALIKVALNWKPEGRRPRGRPWKRWVDVVEKDLEDLGAQNWREIVQDRDKWGDLVMAAKTLGEL
ncbi:hypothetical protein QTP88_002147 [Uroleucon formosanum]